MPRNTLLKRYALHGVAVTLAGFSATVVAAEPAEQPLLKDLPVPEFSDLFGWPFDFSVPPPTSASANKIDPSKFIGKAPAGWDAKVGLDPRTQSLTFRPDQLVPGAPADRSSGIAWANVAAPVVETPWDKASLETRIDPQQQGKLGMSLSRSVPVGESLSMTWLNSYSLTQTLSRNGAPTAADALIATSTPVPGSTQSPAAAQVYGTNQSMRFTFLPSNTSVSFGAALSTVDDKWLRSLSAEQKLFGGPISITGGLTESAPGEYSKSIKAGFKRTW
jgi:hypothetical protein